MEDTRPRRISRWVRYGVALGIALVVVLGWWLWLRSGAADGSEYVVLLSTGCAVAASSFVVWNLGFRPRIRGQFLEVTTLIGRQSLDLTAVTGVNWQRARGGTVSIRLRDDLTDVVLIVPLPPEVFRVTKDALAAAATRGVVLPRRVTTQFGLPTNPGAPRTGSNYPLVMLAVLLVGAALGAVVGLMVGR